MSPHPPTPEAAQAHGPLYGSLIALNHRLTDEHGGQYSALFAAEVGELRSQNPALAEALTRHDPYLRTLAAKGAWRPFAEVANTLGGEVTDTISDVSAYFIGVFGALKRFPPEAIEATTVTKYALLSPKTNSDPGTMSQAQRASRIIQVLDHAPQMLADVKRPRLTAVRYGLGSMACAVLLSCHERDINPVLLAS